jgi:tetratricopeptide (TPR) repeat protein
MRARLILEENQGAVQVLLHREGQIRPEPYGAALPFDIPLTPEEREDLRWYLEDYLEAPYAVYEDRGSTIAQQIPLWGRRLFDAVFGVGEPGRDAYVQARAAGDCELWIASNSPAFLGLPWELLQEQDGSTPLSLELAGVNRTLAANAPAADPRPGERLRVLMVIARPYGRKDVRFRMVAHTLLKRLEPVAGEVQLEVLRPPTFEDLKRRLEKARDEGEPYQILHFDGHGSFGTRGGGGSANPLRYGAPQGYLLFETETGDEDPVAADQIAPLLSEAKVPLLVFNACRSGQIEGGAGPESAVATRLLSGGAAAVVAMSYSVYAVAAAEFMAAFYEALFAGKTVSRAVTEGRRQLQKSDLRPSPKGPLPLDDWLVPVHYARREVVFPTLRPTPSRPGDLSLEQALAGLRQARAVPEGVHEEGDLSPEGGRFFGRDAEFQELEKALRLRHVVVLHGVGGTGKTELAKGFARWLRDSGGLDNPSWVFFHSFEPGIASFGLDGVVASVGLRLFGPDFARHGTEERRHAVLEALRQHRILLVWDNFETVYSLPDPMRATPPLDEAQQQLVRSFLAEVVREARGGVIVTSRSPEDWLGDVHRIEIGGLDRQDANELVETLLAPLPRARERRNDPAYAELLDILGGHPLSLRLILPHLDKVADARELVRALRGERDLPAGFEAGEGRLESLGACVHYSFRHLPEEDQDRLPALTLFEGVADLDVLAIGSETEGAPERFRGIETSTWRSLLDRCVGLGLLTPLGAGMYRIHPALPFYLTMLWKQRAGNAFADEQASARLASIRAHAGLGAWLYQQIQGGDAETAMAVLSAERRTLGSAAGEALDRGLFAEAQSILQPLNRLWDVQGMGEEARAWVDRCREALEDRDGQPPDLDSPPGVLWLFMVGSQANRSLRAGALEEAEAEHNAIRLIFESSGSEAAKRHLAVAYHQLGRVAQDRGDLTAAEAWYRKALEIFEALGARPKMAASYHQLGMVTQYRGDLAAAEAWYRKALEIDEALGNRPGMASSYHQLGMVAQDRGDLAAAEAWYRKSLEIKEALGNRPGMAISYHQLGMLAQDRGDLAAAEAWYRKALEIVEALGDRPKMASSYHQLGIVAQDRGDLTAAEAWYRKALEIVEALGNRPGMALTYAQLGLLTEDREDKAGALDWAVRCVALFPEVPHSATGTGPHQLARLTAELGMAALEASWRRCTGGPLPEAARAWVAGRREEGG